MRYRKLEEVCLQLGVDENLLHRLIEEGLVDVKHTLDDEAVVSEEDVERIRVILLLVREMEVNLPGVEVVLHMREEMYAMRKQFDELVRLLVDALRAKLRE